MCAVYKVRLFIEDDGMLRRDNGSIVERSSFVNERRESDGGEGVVKRKRWVVEDLPRYGFIFEFIFELGK